MIHGNINTRTVFSTKAGEWKLCGLELASSIKEDNPTLTQFHQLPETKHYSPPEVHRDSWTTLRANPVGAVDGKKKVDLTYPRPVFVTKSRLKISLGILLPHIRSF